jgi:ribosomal protein S13
MNEYKNISIKFPTPITFDDIPSSQTGFSVEAQGIGSFTGLAYTVPAHTEGKIEADIKTMAITSEDVKKLNDLVMSMLNASEREKVETHTSTNVSANISVWSMFGGGSGNASYTQTKDTMKSMGLTEEQITTIVESLFDIAQKMSSVKLDFMIYNRDNDYSVSGDLELYTVSGKITTSKGTAEYRFLANKGTAGNGQQTAPADGKIRLS